MSENARWLGARVEEGDGVAGVIEGIVEHAGAPHAVVRRARGERVLVPRARLSARDDGSYVVSSASSRDGDETAQPMVVPVVEERVLVDKQPVEAGGVRVVKRVVTREQPVAVDLGHDEVTTERIPVGRVVDEAPSVRTEGDTLIVPILEEVVVVEKRLMVREELRITRRRVVEHASSTATVRREVVDVESIRASDSGGAPAARHSRPSAP
jgi:uncharacterized protein (TIGR02271 family)